MEWRGTKRQDQGDGRVYTATYQAEAHAGAGSWPRTSCRARGSRPPSEARSAAPASAKAAEKMKILIAYDGSEGADASLDDLPRAGLPRDAEASVVVVAEPWPPRTAINVGGATSDVAEEAARLAGTATDRIRAAFPHWSVRSEVCEGTPARALIDRADAWEPDLLVVGSHGRSAIGRLLLGSVSHKVVSEARCSVRVARRGHEAKEGPVRIVLGVDGSTTATEAARAVAARSWPADSEVRVVSAVPTNAPSVEPGSEHEHIAMQVAEWFAIEERRAEQAVDAAVSLLAAAGLKAVPQVGRGSAKQMLVREAEAWAADCIFVGATGMGRLQQLLLGSVSTAVVMQAACSVEVVRGRSADGP
jgi:nucleotide-binding universal stress UspA family protein